MTTLSPLVSVAMPAYNSEKYIAESIESIINQTYQNWELIIINDASKDNTLEIINKYKLLDSRIKLFNMPQNSGISVARNKCLELSKGKYIANLDSDDIALPERLEKQVEFLEKNPLIGICGTAFSIIGLNEKKQYPSSDSEMRAYMFANFPFANPTIIFRKELIISNNLFYNSVYDPAEDFDFCFRLSKYTQISNLNEVLLLYRQHVNQSSNLFQKNQKNGRKKIRLLQLTNLSIVPSVYEEELHEKIFNYDFVADTQHVLNVIDWLNKIKKSNDEISFYDKYHFNVLLADFMHKNVIHSGVSNFAIYRKLKTSPLFKFRKIAYFEEFKFFFKSILNELGIWEKGK